MTLEDIIVIGYGMPHEESLRKPFEERNKLIDEQEKKRVAHPRKVPEVLHTVGTNRDAAPLRYTATKGKNALSVNVGEYKK